MKMRVNQPGSEGRCWRPARAERGSQLLEFALALPVLLLLLAGILDFGAMFTLKAKLTNSARDAARVVVSTPLTNMNCSSSVPCPIQAAVNDVKNYLTNAGVDASCLDATLPSSSTAVSWTFTCSSGASLTINRGAVVMAGTLAVPSTAVTLQWPATWKLANFLPSSAFPSKVGSTVTMANLTGSS